MKYFYYALVFSMYCLVSSQFLLAQTPTKLDLSPNEWPKDELEKYLELNQHFGRPVPLVYGKKGMIAATSNALAIHAGMEALKKGGSAVDAALITALNQIVLSGGSWNSFAGIMTMLYYDKEEDKVYYLNAGYNIPFEESDPLTIPEMGIPSGRTALVPGFIAGVKAAHDKFGILPFERLFDSPIYFAENGVNLNPLLAFLIQSRKEVLTRLEDTKKAFTNENGKIYSQGELFRQPQLALTLKSIAEQGPDYMYKGDWAKRFIAAVQKEGGKITLRDMEAYKVIWEEPIQGTYKNYRLFVPGLISKGGVNTIEMFNLIEESKLSQYGHYTKSAETLYWLIQIDRLALFLDILPKTFFTKYFPDLEISSSSLIKKETAKLLWSFMQSPSYNSMNEEISKIGEDKTESPKHSDGIVVIDQWGNMAVIVHTINTVNWGTTGIFVDGISIPDSASFQQEAIAKIAPGDRLPDPINPLIVFKEGKLILGSATIGSALYEKSLQVVMNILDFEMDPKSATDMPYFRSPWWPDHWDQQIVKQIVKEGDFEKSILDEVRTKGQNIKEIKLQQLTNNGFWSGIYINPQTGEFEGATSSDLNGNVEGY